MIVVDRKVYIHRKTLCERFCRNGYGHRQIAIASRLAPTGICKLHLQISRVTLHPIPPNSLLNTTMPLLNWLYRTIQRPHRNRNPVSKCATRIRPEQGGPTVPAECSSDARRRLEAFQFARFCVDFHARGGRAGVGGECCAVGFAAFAAVAMGEGFQRAIDAIANGAAEATAVV